MAYRAGLVNPLAQFFTDTGAIAAGYKLNTYVAGSVNTPLATYSDESGTLNSNPVTLDAAGRAPIYFQAADYKLELTTPAGAVVWTQDYVVTPGQWNLPSINGIVYYQTPTVLTLSSNAVTPTQNVHGLDTSGGAQNLNTLTIAGSVASGFQLTLYGNNPGANPVTLVDGAGNMDLAGGNCTLNNANIFIILQLRGTTWFEIARSSASAQVVDNGICQGRMTLTTAVPITTADVTAATTVYFTPYKGNRIGLYDGTNWNIRSFTELNVSLAGLAANTPFDLFAYDNAGTVTLDTPTAWSSDTVRATALTLQDGVLVKSGATTRRYLGTFRTTGTIGQTEDSFAKRYVWNYYNRVSRALRVLETTATWNYTTLTIRQANGAATNQVDMVIGVAEVQMRLKLQVASRNTNADIIRSVGIGQDSTTSFLATELNTGISDGGGTIAVGAVVNHVVHLDMYPAIGRHYYSWNEISTATGTTTWLAMVNPTAGANASQAGLSGAIDG